VADGGATYTVNIELATRQFSQDLRNLKNKIQNDLGKAVKVGGKQGTTSQQRAQQLRERRKAEEDQRRTRYNVDRNKAFQVRLGKATSANLKLEKLGLDVQERKVKLGVASRASQRGEIQFAEAKLKILFEEIDGEFKVLDLINKQAAAEKKAITDKANAATKLENKARKGRYGQRMHGPIDRHGTQIYDGYKNPPIPKRGASLPVDLQRKTSGTFAAKHTDLLRRRQVLETLLSSFDGINTPEINRFKNGIQGLVKQYGAVSTSMGQTRNASGFGNAGNIARELELLELSTKKEEYRARNIKTMNQTEAKAFRTKETFLNKEHSIKKTLFRLQKKGVATTKFELKLEKAITAQDQEQLNTLAREIDMTNAKATRATKKGGGKGKSGSGTVAAKGGGGRWGRMAQSAGISGGFPLLFGQSPLVAGISAGGGALGEAITPGGGFAGGIVASAAATYISEVIAFRKEISNLNKEMSLMGVGAGYSAKEIVKLGNKLNVTKQEALKIAEQFKRFGKDGGLFAEYFGGDIGQFTASVQAVDMQSAMAAIKATSKDLSIEDENRYLILLRTKGVEATINQIVNERIEKQKKARNEEAQKKIKAAEQTSRNVGGERAFGVSMPIDSKHVERVTKKVEADLDAALGDDSKLKENFDKRREQMREAMYEAENLKYSVLTAIDGIDTELRKLNNRQYQVVQLSKSIGSSFSESFKGIVKGSMTAQEALRNLFQRTADHFIDMAARMAATNLQKGILNMLGGSIVDGLSGGGSSGGGSSVGDLASKMGSNFFSSSGADKGGLSFSDAVKIGGKAAGGPVTGGSPYVVGEKGPELFVPGSSGNIVPNHAMGGTNNVVVNVDASGSAVQGDAGQSEQLGSMLAAAVQAELVNQQRPGGLLAGTR